MSSPITYFPFTGMENRKLDIHYLNPSFNPPEAGVQDSVTLETVEKIQQKHLIVGGGGLLYETFKPCYKNLEEVFPRSGGKRIAWGIGQQIYSGTRRDSDSLPEQLNKVKTTFNYGDYLDSFDLVGIRDYGFAYDWVPCVTCMHPGFEQKRSPQHEFVVFSHKKFQISLPGFPHTTNASADLGEILDFLASGETILTSSFHGAYWGTLLGRKVVMFPFSTKFMTLKYLPGVYPVQEWRQKGFYFRPFKETFLNKFVIDLRYKNKYGCDLSEWQTVVKKALVYPDILEEHRARNRWFYQRVMETLNP